MRNKVDIATTVNERLLAEDTKKAQTSWSTMFYFGKKYSSIRKALVYNQPTIGTTTIYFFVDKDTQNYLDLL